MTKIGKLVLSVFALYALVSTTVWADTVEIKGKGVKFDPLVVFAKSGDTIAFRKMASHFVESISIPEGAEKMISDMAADYSYAVKQDGVYFYKCPPHWGVRMGGIIVVGDASGLVDSLKEMKKGSKDKVAKGFLKKILKKIKKGKIELPK